MKLAIKRSGEFKRDVKRIVKRGIDLSELTNVINMLANGETLPGKYKDHALENSRNYKNKRECHVHNDLLLVYQILDDVLILDLVRLGTHSDLFRK